VSPKVTEGDTGVRQVSGTVIEVTASVILLPVTVILL